MTPRFAHYLSHVQHVIDAALEAADPAAAVTAALRRRGNTLEVGRRTYDLERGRLFLIGVGKAVLPMAAATLREVGDLLTAGAIIAKDTARERDPPDLPPSVELFYAGHPVSDEAGVRATKAALALLSDTGPEDLVLCLISGGASALLTAPRLPLAQWQALTTALLESGCDINELNCVRRQLDRVKGGGLWRAAAPAGCAALILSDVVGNPLAAIGSGPTTPTDETAADALAVLRHYAIADAVPPETWRAVVDTLERAPDESSAPAPPPYNLIVGDVARAARAARDAAAGLGFETKIVTTSLAGEARDAGIGAARRALQTPPDHCLIWAGETTVTVRGSGRGGRNQEAALAAVTTLDRDATDGANAPRVALVSFATDGEDRIAGVAGAVVTDRTAAVADALGEDPASYLDRNDSYGFFHKLEEAEREMAGGLLTMPPTGTNVNDLLITFTYAPNAKRGTH